MNPLKVIKAALIGGWILCLLLWAMSSSWSKVAAVSAVDKEKNPPATVKDKDDNYVGSETCKVCHEDQFKNFVHTLNHNYVIDLIWQAHLEGREHGFGARNTPGHPPLAELWRKQQAIDRPEEARRQEDGNDKELVSQVAYLAIEVSQNRQRGCQRRSSSRL